MAFIKDEALSTWICFTTAGGLSVIIEKYFVVFAHVHIVPHGYSLTVVTSLPKVQHSRGYSVNECRSCVAIRHVYDDPMSFLPRENNTHFS